MTSLAAAMTSGPHRRGLPDAKGWPGSTSCMTRRPASLRRGNQHDAGFTSVPGAGATGTRAPRRRPWRRGVPPRRRPQVAHHVDHGSFAQVPAAAERQPGQQSVSAWASAFGQTAIPVLPDWRLRECDDGQRNGMPVAELHAGRRDHLDQPYPDGESWRQAAARVGRFPGDLPLRWNGQRVLVSGHVATRRGLDHLISGVQLEQLAEQDFAWQEGWEYRLS